MGLAGLTSPISAHAIFFTTNEDLARHRRPGTPGPQVLLQLWWVFAAQFWQDVSKHPYAEGRAISTTLRTLNTFQTRHSAEHKL